MKEGSALKQVIIELGFTWKDQISNTAFAMSKRTSRTCTPIKLHYQPPVNILEGYQKVRIQSAFVSQIQSKPEIYKT